MTCGASGGRPRLERTGWTALPEIESAQGWQAGYLSMALSRLVGGADATFQQELESRVERLMTSRGVRHEWGDDLEALQALRFDGA